MCQKVLPHALFEVGVVGGQGPHRASRQPWVSAGIEQLAQRSVRARHVAIELWCCDTPARRVVIRFKKALECPSLRSLDDAVDQLDGVCSGGCVVGDEAAIGEEHRLDGVSQRQGPERLSSASCSRSDTTVATKAVGESVPGAPRPAASRCNDR